MNQTKKRILLKKIKIFISENQFTKSIFECFLTLLVIYLITVFLLKESFVITNFLEVKTAFTLSFTIFIVAFINVLRKKIDHWLEDSTKLTTDYDALLDIYGLEVGESYVKYKNTCSENLMKVGSGFTSCNSDKANYMAYCFPVIKLFTNHGEKHIIVEDSKQQYQLPLLVVNNYVTLFEAHKHSIVYNNLNIRLLDVREFPEDEKVILYTQRTTYFNSLVTNRALDVPLASRLSLRKIYQVGKAVVPLSESVFSNHLGMNGFVETIDEEFVFVKRGNNLSIGKGLLSSSVAASLKTKYALNEKGIFTEELLDYAIEKEIQDELGLGKEDYYFDRRKSIIAGYRDMVEGGKPQLLFYVKSNLTKQELLIQFQSSMDRRGNRKKSQETQMKRDGVVLKFIPKSELGNLFIAPDCIIYNKEKHATVPGVSACLVMLIDYLKGI